MNKKVYILLLAFLIGISLNVVHPITKLYINQLGIDEFMLGVYLAVLNVGLLLMAPFFGNLGDRIGRSRVIVICIAGYGCGQFLFGFFDNQFYILGARFISGIFVSGVFINLYAFVNDNFTDRLTRTKYISYVVSAIILGNSFAYIIGGMLGDKLASLEYVFYIQAFICFSVSIFAFLNRNIGQHHITDLKRSNILDNIKFIKTFSFALIVVMVISLFCSFGVNNAIRYIDYYQIDKGISSTQVGLIAFIGGILILITNLTITPRLLRKYSSNIVGAISLFFASILLVVLVMFSISISFYIVFYLYLMVIALYEPAVVTLIGRESKDHQGIILGVRQSFVSLGATIGFLLSGLIYDTKDIYIFVSSSFMLFAGFLGFLYLIFKKTTKDVL